MGELPVWWINNRADADAESRVSATGIPTNSCVIRGFLLVDV
jgi:hypothetical protein